MAKIINEKPSKNQYLIYTRKSTDDMDNQKNSLAYQLGEGIRFAKLNHLPVASVDIEDFCKWQVPQT